MKRATTVATTLPPVTTLPPATTTTTKSRKRVSWQRQQVKECAEGWMKRYVRVFHHRALPLQLAIPHAIGIPLKRLYEVTPWRWSWGAEFFPWAEHTLRWGSRATVSTASLFSYGRPESNALPRKELHAHWFVLFWETDSVQLIAIYSHVRDVNHSNQTRDKFSQMIPDEAKWSPCCEWSRSSRR